jgi:hypothetical protein
MFKVILCSSWMKKSLLSTNNRKRKNKKISEDGKKTEKYCKKNQFVSINYKNNYGG